MCFSLLLFFRFLTSVRAVGFLNILAYVADLAFAVFEAGLADIISVGNAVAIRTTDVINGTQRSLKVTALAVPH